MLWTTANGGTRKYITGKLSVSSRDAMKSQISADGSTIVFQSDADFRSEGSCYSMTTHQVTCNIAASACTGPNVHYAPGYVSSRNGCCHCVAGCNHTKETGANCPQLPTTTKSKNQIYMTKDEGKSFTLITPSSQTATTNAQGAHVSGDGGLVSFTAKGMTPPEFHAVNQLVSEKDEAWLYHASSNTLAKISNLAGKECSTKSLGSCYSMTTHQVTCNIAASACTSPNVHYAPGFVSSRNGCCHCVAGCDHTKETGANCAASYGQTNVPNIVWKKTVEKYGQANLSAGCHSNFY